MSVASENVLARLQAAPSFHPASAEIFDGLLLDAGDVVTVASGDESYQVPIYVKNLTWNGKAKTTIENSGNETLPPLPELSRRSFAGGAATYNNSKILRDAGLTVNENGVWAFALQQGALGTLRADLNVAASNITSLVTRTGVNSLGANETLYSLISQNADSIALKVAKGDVASQLALECGNVTITNANLTVDGYVTAAEFSALVGNFERVITIGQSATVIAANACTVGELIVNNTSFRLDTGAASWQEQTVVKSVSITLPSVTLSEHSNRYVTMSGDYSDYGYIVTGYSGGNVQVSTVKLYYLGQQQTNNS